MVMSPTFFGAVHADMFSADGYQTVWQILQLFKFVFDGWSSHVDWGQDM